MDRTTYRLMALAGALSLATCDRSSLGLQTEELARWGDSRSARGGDVDAALVTVTVVPRFPAGPNWNDYVRTADPATPCEGSESGATACLHGGELRQVVLPGPTACTGYTAIDALGVFDWSCVAEPGRLVFNSYGLKRHQGLAHLLNAAGFLANHITISHAAVTVARSIPEVWWQNPVLPLPDNSTTSQLALDVPNAIYLLATSRGSHGYRLAASKIALVTLDDATLTYLDDGITACMDPNNGTVACLVELTDPGRFVWLEGNFVGGGASAAGFNVGNTGSAFSRFHRISAYGFSRAIQAARVVHPRFDELHLDHNGIGIYLDNSEFARIAHATLAANGYGIYCGDLNNALLIHDVVAANNDNGGIWLGGSNNTTIAGVTLVNNGSSGLALLAATDGRPTLLQVLDANNDGALNLMGIGRVTFAQLAADAIDLWNVSDGKFTGNLLLAGAGNCTVSTDGDAGLDSSCNLSGLSDATTTRGINLATAFVGKTTVDDAVNPADLNGAATVTTITDWSHFSLPWRAWGNDGGAFPDPSNQGVCAVDTCRIWDWRLRKTDTILRNQSDTATAANDPFVASAPCPQAANGDQVATDQRTTPQVFLLNAFEFLGDGSGDDDALCENNERCLYAPNFGAYQGEGDALAAGTCVFADGAVSGVALYAYPINGGS